MKTQVAVIGFGFMGVVHAKNIVASETMELCGIIDNRDGDIFKGIENTGNAGTQVLPIKQLKAVSIYKSLEECVKTTKVDAVVICVPLFLHYELTKKALELGVDVMVEKPFCPTLEQCRELIKLAIQKNRILMVAHCIRFHPAWKFLAACIDDKRFGELQILSTSRTGGEPTWGVWNDPTIRRTCGGGLWDLVLHDIDFINHHIGIPDGLDVNVNVRDYWETSFTRNGAIISIKGGFLHPHAVFESNFFATFEHASLQYSTANSSVLLVSTQNGLETIDGMGIGSYEAELAYFGNCVKMRIAPSECLPEEATQAISICMQADKK